MLHYWLVTTCNNAIPDDYWSIPNPHPCSIPIANVADEDEDYSNLVNTVQRHTKCSTAYCLRKKPREPDLKCRFKYPQPTRPSSEITFERLGDGTVRATLATKRDDPRVNSHHRLLLQNWRANVDLQIVVDIQACACYMAKYVAKSEPRSRATSEILSACIPTQSDDSDARSILRRTMISTHVVEPAIGVLQLYIHHHLTHW